MFTAAIHIANSASRTAAIVTDSGTLYGANQY